MAKAYRLGPARRGVNPLVSMLLKIGVGDKPYYLLTTTGRTSCQPWTTPVILVHSGPERWLVSPYGQVGCGTQCARPAAGVAAARAHH